MFVFRSIVSRVLLGLVLTAAVGLSVYSGIVPNVLCVALRLSSQYCCDRLVD